MKKFLFWILILLIGTGGIIIYFHYTTIKQEKQQSNETNTQVIENSEIKIEKLGVIAKLSSDVMCAYAGLAEFTEEVEQFNSSHSKVQIQLFTGNTDEEGIVEKMYTTYDLGGLVSTSCGEREQIRKNLSRRYGEGTEDFNTEQPDESQRVVDNGLLDEKNKK